MNKNTCPHCIKGTTLLGNFCECPRGVRAAEIWERRLTHQIELQEARDNRNSRKRIVARGNRIAHSRGEN